MNDYVYINSSLNLNDLKPNQRLKNLIEASAVTCVDPQVPIEKYFNLCTALLRRGKQFQEEGNNELGLLYYMRYQSVNRKMRRHPRYTRTSIGKITAFAYKFNIVTKIVKELTKTVLRDYERAYTRSKLCVEMDDNDFFNDERRYTLSTIKTFVSGPESVISLERYAKPPSKHKLSILPKYITREEERSSLETVNASLKSKTDTLISLRKNIFPPKQVRDFDKLHRQRRIVKGLRTLRLPSRITTEFSYLSFQDVQKNVETVGYLAGQEQDDGQLLVTHLVLPEQVGYSDFFKVKDSGTLTKYLEQHDLLILGWIHSHPMDRPYLSSSDMHYHSVFQCVFPEAVAMVYSPKFMKSDIFNLTPDHGVDFILNCRKKGFHSHPTVPPITMTSQHAVVDLIGELTVKDFRNIRKVYREDKEYHSGFLDRTLRSKSNDIFRRRKSEVVFASIE